MSTTRGHTGTRTDHQFEALREHLNGLTVVETTNPCVLISQGAIAAVVGGEQFAEMIFEAEEAAREAGDAELADLLRRIDEAVQSDA